MPTKTGPRPPANDRSIGLLNKRTKQEVDYPDALSTKRDVPNPKQPGVRAAKLPEAGTGRG